MKYNLHYININSKKIFLGIFFTIDCSYNLYFFLNKYEKKQKHIEKIDPYSIYNEKYSLMLRNFINGKYKYSVPKFFILKNNDKITLEFSREDGFFLQFTTNIDFVALEGLQLRNIKILSIENNENINLINNKKRNYKNLLE